MSLSYILIAYLIIAAIFLIVSIIVLAFTWRFRYLGPATYVIVALFITLIVINTVLTTWYILRTDWTYNIGFTLGL